MIFSKWNAFLLSLVFALSVQAASTPQEQQPPPGYRIHRSIPPSGAKTHVVVPGERFRASGFKRWIYGSDYRDPWTTPIEVAVLDLDSVGGGLTPLRTGGFGQSISLHFTGEDGRRYTVRSLDKDPTKRIWDQLKGTIAEDFLQDMISALLPTGALVVDPLMEATGILHSKHTLVIIPDDPRLKEYREEFAGLVGTLQEHPSEGPDNTPGFAGSRQISGTERLWEHLEETPLNRVDAHAFLKARLMDFLINDKDRHHGQWRWARFPNGEGYTWVPIPEDRDQAFIDLDGFAMTAARRGVPRFIIQFEEKYTNLLGLTSTGSELDREFLVELDKATWDSVVATFCTELSDPVIEDAVRKLPQPYYEIVGETLTETLKARRDALPKFADRYYKWITRQAEIQATDQNEYVQCEHTPGGDLVVRIGRIEGPDGGREAPYFQRTFRPKETREVRIYLRGGDDHVEISGAKGRIVVRIDGGGGADTFTNASEAGASKTQFYDSRGKNRFVKGKGAKIDESPYKRAPAHLTRVALARYALDWGIESYTFPTITVNPDLGLFMRVHHNRQYFGYRKIPFSSRHTSDIGLATNGLTPFASYTGNFRRLLSDFDARVHFKYSGIQIIRFNGFGNDTQIPEPTAFYKVEQSHFVFAPSLDFRKKEHDEDAPSGSVEPLRSVLTFRMGPVIKYSNTSPDANKDKFISSLNDPVYGTGSFGQVGASGEIMYDTRNNPAYPTQGAFVRAAGAVYPGIWNAESAFGSIDGAVHTYVTAPVPTRPTLALRVGGKKVWGTFPFHESAFLGGPGFIGIGSSDSHLRGFRKNRFAGDTSLYANVELRLVLLPIQLLVPGELGVFIAADAGRVFFAEAPNETDTWHRSVGGGFWLSFFQRRQTLSVAVVDGDDLMGVYLRAGFMF
ncbi:MAG: BamA/TamA family outer membrane protein [Candidatus Poribacteria bacterium]|nr:BamA/TamA family outer membrane protein [Candidatus Poribacteria bacterium]